MTTTAAFVETLRYCGLLEAKQLHEISPATRKTSDPRPLARHLVEQGWITTFQANQLLRGQGQQLVLGSYVLLEKLGAGGMGQVYKARHQKLGRIVAVKVIRPDRLRDPDTVIRFHREIRAASQLAHPNIVLALDADEINGTHFFAMEYVEGHDLASLVKRGGPLPTVEAVEYIRQAACGLAHAHSKKLVHRDIKPSNLLVSWSSRQGSALSGTATPGSGEAVVKILDFGIARLHFPDDENEDSQMLTQKGVLMGTADYVAPEQAVNPHGADIRCDLYSLGCTFYLILTGSLPYPGGTTVEKLFKHRLEEPVPVELLRPEVPAEVGVIVRRLMAKNPDDRYQTPAELISALSRLGQTLRLSGDFRPAGLMDTYRGRTEHDSATEEQAAAGVPSIRARAKLTRRLPLFPRSSSRHVSRLTYLCAAAVALLLAGVLGAAYLAMSPGDPPRTPGFGAVSSRPDRTYVRRSTREETILATLKANGLPTLEGKWYSIGPFDNTDEKGFAEAFPPEKEIRLDGTYRGKKDRAVRWTEMPGFRLGSVVDLRLYDDNDLSCIYLLHIFEAKTEAELPLSLGSDDTLTVWLNGERLLAKQTRRGCVPDDDHVTLRCKPGRNELLVKVCNFNGAWAVYVMPQLPPALETAFSASLRRDFPPKATK